MSVSLDVPAGIIISLKCERTFTHPAQHVCVSGAAEPFYLKEMKLRKSQAVNINNKRATKLARIFRGDSGPADRLSLVCSMMTR